MRKVKSLWNQTEGKTKKVIKFIEEMGYLASFEKYHKQKFEQIRQKALNEIQPNDMLTKIGYTNEKFLPNIYQWVCK